MEVRLHLIDGIIVVVYMLLLAGVGAYWSRRQVDLDGFFRAHRGMAWFPVGLSLMAALNSGLDYLMQPWSVIKYGLILTINALSWIPLYFWMSRVTLPFYRRLDVDSVYEYLERRFDIRVRTMGAVIFMLWRLGWMGTALYVPCLAISGATGGKIPVWSMVVAIGSLVTIYTMLGGIKGVIWTDVIQFCIMIGGVSATVLIIVASVPGGFSEVWANAVATGKANFTLQVPGMAQASGIGDKLRVFFTEPVHFWPLIFSSIVPLGRMAGFTVDQIMVQRLQTTRNVAESKRAFVINAIGDSFWMTALAGVGMALWAYFQHHPLPAEFQNDKILPYFMSSVFPAGAVGLVIAAIMAASLSSIDSAINSCSSVLVIDFYNRLWKRREMIGDATREHQSAQIRLSRIFTVFLGIAMMALALNVHRVGDLIEVMNKVIGLFIGPLLVVFMLGMFSRRADANAALIGGLCGSITSLWVAFGSTASFLWVFTAGFAVTYLVGFCMSLVSRPLSREAASYTFREVLRRPEPGIAARPSIIDSNDLLDEELV